MPGRPLRFRLQACVPMRRMTYRGGRGPGFLLLLLLSSHLLAQGPRFERLSPRASGIDFENTLDDTPARNILIYSNYYGGAGVGIGDLNNDGLPDLFFAGNLVPDRLYLNEGGLHFRDISAEAGIAADGTWSTSVIMADVNNDGWLDIYVARELYDHQPHLRRNALYINQGDLTFVDEAAKWGVADTARTRHATFLDYDRDGDLDLFLLNQPPNPGNYSDLLGEDLTRDIYRPRLYRHDGDHFTDVSQAAGIFDPGFGNSVSASDFNGDGWPDLYVANDFDQPDRLYLNQQDGRFVNVIDTAMGHISFYSMGSDAADLNNDGLLDLMVLDMVAEDNFRLKANMSGMNPQAFWDVVAKGGHYQYMYNTLQLNQGNGHFSEVGHLAGMQSTDWSWSVLLADLDNDGWKDVFITNGLLRDIRNSDAAKTFPKYVSHAIEEFVAANPNAGDVSIWDVLDLDEALALLPSVPLRNYAFRNEGNLRFSKVMAEWGLDDEAFSHGAAYADLDLDGDLDLVVSNVNSPATVYRNQTRERGEGQYLRVRLGGTQPVFGAKARIETATGLQFAELTNVRGIYSTSEHAFHFGLGDLTQVDRLEVTWPDGRVSVLTDVAAGQTLLLDPATAQAAGPPRPAPAPAFRDHTQAAGLDHWHRENAYDDFEREVLLPHRMSTWGPALAVADVNGDGWEDFYVGGAVGSAGVLYLQQPDGRFVAQEKGPWAVHRAFEDTGAAFFDADNDGDPDLYVASGGNEYEPGTQGYMDRLYLNEGDGTFKHKYSALPMLFSSSSCVRPFDFDGDGDLDLFIGGRQVPGAYPRPATSYLLRNDGSGGEALHFTDVSASLAPMLENLGMVTDARWTDLDGDGLTDLLVVGEWMPLTCLRQVGDRFEDMTAAWEMAPHTGWWFSLSAADMDGDGDDDYVVGNLGQNYKYQARPGAPFHIYYDDFDENGSYDIVLGYHSESELYPLRGRSCSSQQVPALAKKFPTYNAFAAATLAEVYGTSNLQQALRYEANRFGSVYIENLGGGQFRLQDLPIMAQIAPVQASLLTDVDGDGQRDIVLAGNLYGAEIETPRADAGMGLWLKGDGQGGFTPVAPQKSGLCLPYDVRALAPIRTPAGPAVLSAANQGPLRLIRMGP